MNRPVVIRNYKWYILLFTGILSLLCPKKIQAQKNDTTIVYLDENLLFCSQKNSYYPAIAIKKEDHWKLLVVYPDSSLLLDATYADAQLRLKNGPFTLYHPNRIKAMEGHYRMNVQEGLWRYWHSNGTLKDSGQIVHDILVDEWRSFDEQGMPETKATYLSNSTGLKMTGPKKPNQYAHSVFAKDTLLKILDGPYTAYYANGHEKETGTYERDQRTGLWKTYYPTGIVESEGYYLEDKQDSSWTYFYENGHTSTKEQYRNAQIVALECFDSTGNATGTYCSIVKPPVPLLSRFENFKDHMLEHIFWPKELADKNVNGMVVIRCTINKKGELATFEIVQSPHELLSKEVERYFKSIPQWSPAISHNRPINYSFEMEIPFIR